MARQRIEPPKISSGRFVLLLAFVLGSLALMLGLCQWLTALTGIGMFDALFMAFAIVLLFMLVRRATLTYVYDLSGEDLRLVKSYGDKVNTLLEMKTKQIKQVIPYKKDEMNRSDYRSFSRIGPRKQLKTLLVFEQEGKLHAVAFAGDDDFVAAVVAAQVQAKTQYETRNENDNE